MLARRMQRVPDAVRIDPTETSPAVGVDGPVPLNHRSKRVIVRPDRSDIVLYSRGREVSTLLVSETGESKTVTDRRTAAFLFTDLVGLPRYLPRYLPSTRKRCVRSILVYFAPFWREQRAWRSRTSVTASWPSTAALAGLWTAP